MSFSPAWLLVSIVISGIGLGLFLYGKKQARIPHLVMGIVLMLYTYAVSSVLWMVVIGVLLLAALWFFVRLGW
jgi:branched-subunit amino acid transport protein